MKKIKVVIVFLEKLCVYLVKTHCTMKKIKVLILLCMGFANLLFAQSSIGFKGGINLCKMDFEKAAQVPANESIRRANLGLIYNYEIDRYVSVYSELNLSGKGYRSVGSSDSQEPVRDLSLNFLEVPVMARIKYGNEKVSIYLNAGPSLGYWSGGSVRTYLNSGRDKNYSNKYKIVFEENPTGGDVYADHQTRWEYSFNYGGGLLFKTKNSGFLMLDLRYNQGVNELFKSNLPHLQPRTRTHSFSVGYLFPFNSN